MTENITVDVFDEGDRDFFIAVFRDVWEVLKGDSALFVYMALRNRVTPDRPGWFSTVKKLAAEAGISESTFKRGVSRLEELGLLVTRRRFVPPGWDGTDSGAIVFNQRDDAHPVEIGKLYLLRLHLPAQGKGGGGKFEPTPPPKIDRGGGGKFEPTPPPKIDLQIKNPLEEEPFRGRTNIFMGNSGEKDEEPKTTSPARSKKNVEDEFDAWWVHVPRKRAKGDARKAFTAARKKASLEELIEGMRRSKRLWEAEGRSLSVIPYPATWLRSESWLDEEDPWVAGGNSEPVVDPEVQRLQRLAQWGSKSAQAALQARRAPVVDGLIIEHDDRPVRGELGGSGGYR